jgi:translocating chain-associated membrane protein 1
MYLLGCCFSREDYFSHIALLWDGFPHLEMSFVLKFFMLIQLSYWLHWLPEMYFIRMKREEIPQKLAITAAYTTVITVAYLAKYEILFYLVNFFIESASH